MKNKPFLLTYQTEKGTTFSWFDTEIEMDNFIDKEKKIHVIDRLHILKAEEI